MNEQQTTTAQAAGNPQRTAKIVKWAIVLGIVIVLNLFFNYAISLVYKEPMFDKFCPVELNSTTYSDRDSCNKVGGMWSESTYPESLDEKGKTTPAKIVGYCNATYTCNNQYMDAQSVYNRNVFIALIILGILSLALGAYLTHLSSAVALGFSFGGVLSLIIGAMRYWSNMQDVLRVVVLAIALAALVWIGIKKIKE